ncbi:hypothetical protein PUMCH_004063 [Australozyma saopauloensis]|uniref:Zn(2)-C6 fungal-type domain-containing protein n=1 Tax=Australozyma saopauloensis TaxID=291208 RepID=A0AAX4HDW2_9ASCO|nr:hypothetical protein PUMCH_004063 [[Candida] saopauloensis]
MTKLQENSCFVFPAFNTNYKTRKRTFRCCRTCRSKRTKCILLDYNYDKSGCDNCRAAGVKCDLIKADQLLDQPPQKLQRGLSRTAVPTKLEPGAPVDQQAPSAVPVSNFAFYNPVPPPPPAGGPLGMAVAAPLYVPVQFTNAPMVPVAALGPHLHPSLRAIKMETSDVAVAPSIEPELKLYSPLLLAQPLLLLLYPTFDPNTNSAMLLPQTQPSHPSVPSHPSHHSHPPPFMPNMSNPQMLPPPDIVTPAYPVAVAPTYIPAPIIPQQLNDAKTNVSTPRYSRASSSNASSTMPYNDYGIDMLKEPLRNFHFTWNNLDFVDQFIDKVDHHFLKHHFDFNTTLQRTKVTFRSYHASDRLPSVDLMDSKLVKRMTDDFGEPVVKHVSPATAITLVELNLQHFKFLLCIHAFTLNTPGFFVISHSDLKKLLEIYFYKINSIFPMVFEEEFWELFNRNKLSNVMLYAVVLNAARDELAEPILKRAFVNKDQDFSVNCMNLYNKLDMKIRQLLTFLPELGDAEKLNRLVTQLLLAHVFKYNKFGSEQSSGDITDCIGYAHSLAIHQVFFHEKITKSGAGKKSQYLKQLWWILFIFDRFNGLLNGKAFFIRRLDFNIDRPVETPHLNKLVGLAYTLEDTTIAIYRTKRKSDPDATPIQPDKAPDDPDFNPRKIVEDEFNLINDPSYNRRNEISGEVFDSGHLPKISIDVYRGRIIFFLERLIRFWVILILRLSQIKATQGTYEQDSFLSQMNVRIFESFRTLRGDHGHKLVISTPIIPLVLLSAFSSPIKAQMLGQKAMNGFKKLEGQPLESFKLTEFYRRELDLFSDKWWFVREVLNTFEKLQQQVRTSKTHEPNATHHSKRVTDKCSIGSLLSAVGDAETVLPLQLSIASPGFYEDVIIKEEEDDEVEEEGADGNEGDAVGLTNGTAVQVQSALPSAAEDDDWSTSKALSSLVSSSQMPSPMRMLSADEVNFDISDMAEMVNMELSFIPTVMDFFSVLHNFI